MGSSILNRMLLYRVFVQEILASACFQSNNQYTRVTCQIRNTIYQLKTVSYSMDYIKSESLIFFYLFQKKMFSWLIVPLRIFRLLIDWLTDLVYGWIYESDRTNGPRIPPISDVILLDPATVLAEKIRSKKIKVSLRSWTLGII